MCLSPKVPDAAAEARAAEAARQARITQGMSDIDQNFSQFDDTFYDTRKSAYTDYYNPQVDNQYEDARRKLVLALGRSGALQGSAGRNKLADLTEDYQMQRTAISDAANSYASSVRGDVERNRSELVSQLNASADPAAAASSAAARAAQLNTAAAFSPLADLFGQYAQMGATGLMAEGAGRRGFGLNLYGSGSGGSRGSSYNVNT